MVIPSYAEKALDALERAGFESYAVGGCVRDSLLGITPHDWDLCTAARPEEVQRVFEGERLLLTGLQHGTVTLLTDGGPLEITTFRTEGAYSDNRHPDAVAFVSELALDLSRRDFTVNAMAYSPRRGLVDLFGGQEDLKAGLIRCVGAAEERFREDALRILRALRFAARFGFAIEPDTADALRRCRELLGNISVERIFTELKGILCARGACDMLLTFPEVFFTVLPELTPMYGFDQHRPDCHQWDVWGHTAHALDAAPPDEVLRLTLLLHDSGKPDCFCLDDTGRARFFRHPAVGAEIADTVLRRLRCDNETRECVCKLVTHHEMRTGHSKKSLLRLLRLLGEEDMRRLMQVRRADADAHAPGAREKLLQMAEDDALMLEELIAEGHCLTVRDLAIKGADVLALGIPAGPAVGQLLKALLDAVSEGELPNEKETLAERAKRWMEENMERDTVTVTWLGHSCFRMEYKGWSLVIDPYDDGSVDGLPPLRVSASQVYCSHDHRDHNAADRILVTGDAAPAEFSEKHFTVPHDHANGKKRGMNLIHAFTFGALRVVHMGDVGCMPEEEVLKELRGCDLLILPVGGFFTVDAAEAHEIYRAVAPRCVVPMHYRGKGFGYLVIAKRDSFTKRFEDGTYLDSPTFTLTKDTPSGLIVPTL